MATKVSFEGERELRWREIGHCLVCYMEAETTFSDNLWDAWMAAMQRPSIHSAMICSWGATQPSHQQWRRATRMMRDRQLTVAVVTQDRHNLALAKAALWLGTNITSHRWSELGEACVFVGFESDTKIVDQAKIIALRDRFGAVTSDPELGQAGTRSANRSVEWEASSSLVFENSKEIQNKLAEIQARFRRRNMELAAASGGGPLD